MKYILEFIPGTEVWVRKELEEKHSESKLMEIKNNLIILQSDEKLELFSDLLSGIRINLEGEPNSLNLYRRDWRKEFVPAGINPALAYVMCQIADSNEDDVVLDPFCGGGTIAISASLYFPIKQVMASDISGKAIDITTRNVEKAGIKNIMVFRSDVAKLKLGKNSVTKIITNLPFGIREKTHDKNIKIYSDLAKIAKNVLSGNGLIVVLTQELQLLQEIFAKSELLKIGDYPIEQGGLKPHIFVYKKL